MNTKRYFNWNYNISPDYYSVNQLDALSFGMGERGLIGQAKVRYCAFSLGFFGFHYIRAVNENDTFLQRESFEIIRRISDSSGLDIDLINQLKTDQKLSYMEYWSDVLGKISFELGDLYGPQAQHGVQLSYWLAANYASLYGQIETPGSSRTQESLKILEYYIPRLCQLALQARIPDRSRFFLAEVARVVRGSKSRPNARKCVKNIEFVLREMLLPTAAGAY